MNIRIVLFTLLFSVFTFAQEGYSVDPFTFGISIGGSGALTDSLSNDDESSLFLAGISGTWALNPTIAVPVELEWHSLKNFGFFAGIEGAFGTKQIRPLIGGSVGGMYMDEGGFGLALKGVAGLQLNLSRTFGIKIKVPYRIVFNDNKDQMVGGEITLIWFSKFRHVQTIM